MRQREMNGVENGSVEREPEGAAQTVSSVLNRTGIADNAVTMAPAALRSSSPRRASRGTRSNSHHTQSDIHAIGSIHITI